jgi:hypothetical protein
MQTTQQQEKNKKKKRELNLKVNEVEQEILIKTDDVTQDLESPR